MKEDVMRIRARQIALVAAVLSLTACDPPAGAPSGLGKNDGLGGADLNIWRDPSTGCRYYVYSFMGGSNQAVGSLSIRYLANGKPDCPAPEARP